MSAFASAAIKFILCLMRVECISGNFIGELESRLRNVGWLFRMFMPLREVIALMTYLTIINVKCIKFVIRILYIKNLFFIKLSFL